MNRKSSKTAASKADKLPREEWDFRSAFEPKGDKGAPFGPGRHFQPMQFLPEEEVDVCHTYEMAREDKSWREQLLKWREPSGAKTFEGLMAYRQRHWIEERREQPPWQFYAYWPEWPEVPYLKIKPGVRGNYWLAWTGRKFGESPRLDVAPINYLFAYRDYICREFSDNEHAGEFETARIDRTGEVITFTGPLAKTREIAAFRIDYNSPNSELVRRFQRWLDERRAVNGIQNPESRGEKSFVSRLRSELCALGAWRLAGRGSMTYENAEGYTAAVSGKPLYAGIATWSRNVNPSAGHPCHDFEWWYTCFVHRRMEQRLRRKRS